MTTFPASPSPASGPVPVLADTAADAACVLGDAVTDHGWPADRAGALDTLDGLDALLDALALLDADTARLLAPAALAAARVRQHLDPTAGPVPPLRLLYRPPASPPLGAGGRNGAASAPDTGV